MKPEKVDPLDPIVAPETSKWVTHPKPMTPNIELAELPIDKVREAVELLIKNSLGSTVGPAGGTCVIVRMQDFAGLEHYLRAKWVTTHTQSLETRLAYAEDALAKNDLARQNAGGMEMRIGELEEENKRLREKVISEQDLFDRAHKRAEAGEMENKRLREALEEVSKGQGAFSRDPLIHAENCITEMKSIAKQALTKPT